jgi:outer membrane protein assembly factor BamB
MHSKRSSVIGVFVVVVLAIGVAGQSRPADWPQWRGPNRDGGVASFTEPKSWPERLTLKWKVEVGPGYATPIVVGSRVYTFTRRDDDELLMALDTDTGKVIWHTRYPAPFTMNPAAAAHGKGPKSTPAFANGRLFTLGMSGVVTAFDATTGKQLWQRAAAPKGPLYGTAMSPLVDGDLVIVHVGGHDQGALTAFGAETGTAKWTWNGDGPAYGSPIVAELGGTRQVVTITQDNLVGVSAAKGELLWRRPFTTAYTQNAITPILYGDTLIVSGLEKGVTAFRVLKRDSRWATENVWENKDVSMYMANGVIIHDTLFGLSHRRSGQFFCLDAKTGKTLWTTAGRQATNAAIVRAGELLFVLDDDAQLIVARSSLTGFEPLRRYSVADSATWAQPAISGNRVFVKDESTLALWTLSEALPTPMLR